MMRARWLMCLFEAERLLGRRLISDKISEMWTETDDDLFDVANLYQQLQRQLRFNVWSKIPLLLSHSHCYEDHQP